MANAGWHLNTDRPWRTRHPEPDGWGSTITSTGQARGLEPDLAAEANAWHEAAHTVLYLWSGVVVEYVTLDIADERHVSGGQAMTMVAPYDLPLGQAIVCLAVGERAEDRWLAQRGLWTPVRAWAVERHAYRDRAAAADLLHRGMSATMTFGTDPGAGTDYATYLTDADAALNDAWDDVEALAHELLRTRHLTGDQATAVIRRS